MSVVRLANVDQWTVVDYVETWTTQLDLTPCPEKKKNERKTKQTKDKGKENKQTKKSLQTLK